MKRVQRTVFLSSGDRLTGGDNYDFRIDLSTVVTSLGPEFEQQGEKSKDITIHAAVEQLYIPLSSGNQGAMAREPPYTVTIAGQTVVPQVNMLRLHCDATHDNMIANGGTNTILQLPFMDHYKEALPLPTSRSINFSTNHAHLSYAARHGTQHGMFKLMHGFNGLHTIRFWLTDEKDRMVKPLPSKDVHITLLLIAESTAHERDRHSDLTRLLKENAHLTRLLVIQNDDKRNALAYLMRHNEHQDRRNKRNTIK